MPPATVSMYFIFLSLLPLACATWTTEKCQLLLSTWDSSANRGVHIFLHVRLCLFGSGILQWKQNLKTFTQTLVKSSNAQYQHFQMLKCLTLKIGNLWLPCVYLLSNVIRRFGEHLGWSLFSLVLLKKSAFLYCFCFCFLKLFMPGTMK